MPPKPLPPEPGPAANPPSYAELARRASELGFTTTADDYRLIDNRLVALRNVLNVVREIEVTGSEPAGVFEPASAPGTAAVHDHASTRDADRNG